MIGHKNDLISITIQRKMSKFFHHQLFIQHQIFSKPTKVHLQTKAIGSGVIMTQRTLIMYVHVQCTYIYIEPAVICS